MVGKFLTSSVAQKAGKEQREHGKSKEVKFEITVHANKAYSSVGVTAPPILNPCTEWR